MGARTREKKLEKDKKEKLEIKKKIIDIYPGEVMTTADKGWVAGRRPRPTLRQGCTCLGANWRPWHLKLKLSLSQKVGCTIVVITPKSGTSVHLG